MKKEAKMVERKGREERGVGKDEVVGKGREEGIEEEGSS